MFMSFVLALLLASPQAQPASLDRAQALVKQAQWAQAEAELRRILAGDEKHSAAWLLLGQSLYRQKRYDDALTAFERAGAAGAPKGLVLYNVACMHALMGRADQAFAALEQSVQIGFAGVPQLEGDDDLVSLRGDARFPALLETAKRRATPCQFDERYRGFDFWIGDWDVVVATGQKVGTNRITSIVGGCAIHEFWTSANGSTGQSLNYFDPAIGKWRQDWVAQVGSVIHYIGELRGGAMHFEGESVGRNGATTRQRARFVRERDGRVRQTIENSSDGGKTWTVGFDAWYVRVEKR